MPPSKPPAGAPPSSEPQPIVESKPAIAQAPSSDEDPTAIWDRVAQLAREENPSILSVVDATRLESITGLSAKLAITSDSLASYVRSRKGALEELLAKICGRSLRIEFAEAFGDASESHESAAQQSSPRGGVDPVAQAEVMKDPVVRRAVDLFGARIVEISDEPKEER